MTDDRELTFERIRRALSGRGERAARPNYADELTVAERVLAQKSLMEAFAERLTRVRGLLFSDPSALGRWLFERGATRGYVDPALLGLLAPSFSQQFRLETELDRLRIDDYDFGITRAVGAIAETGTVVLNDQTTSRRLGALAPWIHIAVVEESTLFRDVAQAIRALGDDPNVIWCTGPSKTADVEGILIEGVHGPGEQGVLFVPQFSAF
jgi:L-lactate dehydrogenase complex protein LldG